jgi:hypothetical protein
MCLQFFVAPLMKVDTLEREVGAMGIATLVPKCHNQRAMMHHALCTMLHALHMAPTTCGPGKAVQANRGWRRRHTVLFRL